MASPTIKTQPRAVTVEEGKPATFTVVAEGEELAFDWLQNGKAGRGNASSEAGTSTYALSAVSADENGDAVVVRVKDKADRSVESAPVTLTVTSKEETVLWVPPFARRSAAVVLGIVALVFVPVGFVLGDILKGATDASGIAGAVAVLLVAVGVLVVAAGVYLALLEFRGRARTLAELKALRELAERGTVAVPPDLIKALPETLKAFGQLRATAALLATAVVLFVCGTIVANTLAGGEEPAPEPTTVATVAP